MTKRAGLIPLGLARVIGFSMRPTMAEGNVILVRYGASVRAGQVVLARLADGRVVAKRAVERRTTATGRPGWWLLSDDQVVGIDSRHRGPVADDDVLAVVLARVWPWPRPLRHAPGDTGAAT